MLPWQCSRHCKLVFWDRAAHAGESGAPERGRRREAGVAGGRATEHVVPSCHVGVSGTPRTSTSPAIREK